MAESKLELEMREAVFHSVKTGTDYNVLEVKLSELPPELRTTAVLNKAENIFAEITVPDGEVFRVPSDDFLVFYPKRFDKDSVWALLIRIWFLFTKDPEELMKQNLAVIRSLPEEKTAILEAIAVACNRPAHAQAKVYVDESDEEIVPKKLEKLTPEGLDKAIGVLSGADFSSMIRRQSICAVVDNAPPQELFEEVYTSTEDLGTAVLPGVDLTAAPWLFQYLTETMDKRVLATVSRHEDGSFNRDFSLNLNVSTILSDSFEDFNYNIRSSMRSSIVFELSLVDIFSDLPSYLKARDIAQKLGYKICLDMVKPMMLPFTDRERLGADFLKLVYTPDLFEKMESSPDFAALVTAVGDNRLILTAVDEKKVFEKAKTMGFTMFQGKFVQTLLSMARNRTY